MNYQNIYDRLINKAKVRVCSFHTENHHIIPKCIGGNDNDENLVKLTPEEHYVAHQLLAKIHKDNPKLIYAAAMMMSNRPNNKIYGWIKRKQAIAYSKQYTGRKSGYMWITNGTDSKIVKNTTPIPENWFLGRIGRKQSENSKAKISKSVKGKYLNMKWITNGISNTRIHKTKEIPPGWYLGRGSYKK